MIIISMAINTMTTVAMAASSRVYRTAYQVNLKGVAVGPPSWER